MSYDENLTEIELNLPSFGFVVGTPNDCRFSLA